MADTLQVRLRAWAGIRSDTEARDEHLAADRLDALEADALAAARAALEQVGKSSNPCTCDHYTGEVAICKLCLGRKMGNTELDKLRNDLSTARAALRQFVELLDGQTEPLHPVSWQVELAAAKAALKETP